MLPRPIAAIIDDDLDIRALVEDYLKNYNIRVEPFSKGSEAIRFCEQSGHFSLILCDLNLDEESGLEISEKLKKFCPASKVILMTAFQGKQAPSFGDYIDETWDKVTGLAQLGLILSNLGAANSFLAS